MKTIQQAIKTFTAERACLEKKIKGCPGGNLCYECPTSYEQGTNGDRLKYLDLVLQVLRHSAPNGEWQVVGRIMKNGKPLAVKCSRCGNSPKYAVTSDFCPNCGAMMTLSEELKND